jgi:hypothetical protein
MTTKRKSIKTITDPLLEPYFITKDEYSYTIKMNVTSDSTHFRAKGKTKTYEKSLYYYPTISQTLMRISELQSNDKDYTKLSEYIENYNQITINLKHYVDERAKRIL